MSETAPFNAVQTWLRRRWRRPETADRTAWTADSTHTHSNGRTNTAAMPESNPLQHMCLRVLPIWIRHIESVREQSESAVATLITRFTRLIDTLGTAVAAAETGSGGSHDALASLLQGGERRLLDLLETLRAAQENRDAALAPVLGLGARTDELQDMARAVTTISGQTRLLSLNATIEAVHAGDHGRGFEVVAREVRGLAARANEAGTRMETRMHEIGSLLDGAAAVAGECIARDRQALAEAETTLRGVLGEFGSVSGQLAASTTALLGVSTGVQGEIAEVLVALQFQDRTSQILAQLIEAMRTLQTLLESGTADAATLDAWFAAMERAYTTVEQLEHHRGGAVAADGAGEITFF